MHLDSSKSSAAVATSEGLEMLTVLPHEHSMFMNCVLATCEQLGADVVAKLCSVFAMHCSSES